MLPEQEDVETVVAVACRNPPPQDPRELLKHFLVLYFLGCVTVGAAFRVFFSEWGIPVSLENSFLSLGNRWGFGEVK